MHLPPDVEIEVEKGLVVLGANGSGKTRLGNWFDKWSPDKELVMRIPAQRLLLMPNAGVISDSDHCKKQVLYGENTAFNKNSPQFSPRVYHNDFDRLMDFCFSERATLMYEYCRDSKRAESKIELRLSILEKTAIIWQEIMPHLELIIEERSIHTRHLGKALTYMPGEMSDGERLVFYLIAKCMCAPTNGIIVIDEPEIHLHKSILKLLWDKIEVARSDCKFVYITHDLDFAASRYSLKKIWLESFDGKEWKWDILEPDNLIPESLQFELRGSRRDILFVEGLVGGNDHIFYTQIFPSLYVKPCGSNEEVITYTTALNCNKEFHDIKVYGLIDRDRKSDAIVDSLKSKNIFCLEVAEFENLFLVPEVITVVCEKKAYYPTDEYLQQIKEFVLNQLEDQKDSQLREIVQQEVLQVISSLNLKSRSIQDLDVVVRSISSNVCVPYLATSHSKLLENILSTKNYLQALKIFNRKSLSSQAGSIIGMSSKELPNMVIRLSKSEPAIIAVALKEHIPEVLRNYLAK